MKKLKQIIAVYGWKGGFMLILYKLFYPRLQAFKSSLILLEWSRKNNKKLCKREGGTILHGLPYFPDKSLVFRPFTSDSMVLRQHFFSRELAPVVAYFQSINKSPKLMIDAGGNIGAAACFIHWHFPGMRSLILEPSFSNSKLAKQNLVGEKATIWEKALWWREEQLFLDGSRSAWAMSVGNSLVKGQPVVGISLSNILKNEEFSNPDYIKVDIEGAEEIILEKDKKLSSMLSNVSCISLEPHSEYGQSLIEQKLLEWGFRIEFHGELIIGFR